MRNVPPENAPVAPNPNPENPIPDEAKKELEGKEEEEQDPWIRLKNEIQKHSEEHIGADESIELIESTSESMRTS